MIIGDKIIALRRQNDWSQEQLAEQLGVSGQSVSDWESGAAAPSLDLILKMSELFGVSVDYLVKDEMVYTKEEAADETTGRMVTVEEANSYMELVRKVAKKIAGGVVLCILSPILLILFGGISEYKNTGVSEDLLGGIGVVVLLIIVAVAVTLFIMNGLKLEKFEYLEKEQITLGYGVKGIVEKKKQEYEAVFHRSIAVGVIFCILSVAPLIIIACATEDEFCVICGVDLLLIMVAIGVYQLVATGMIWGSYQKLLQEGDYTVEQKKSNKKIEGFAGVYWCVITAVYLGISFLMNNWEISWVIWPVAGVLFGAITGFIKLIRK